MTVVQIRNGKRTGMRGKRIGERSKVTNGRMAFVEGDGRSPWSRRWSDLVFAHACDLGGPEGLSEAQVSICRRASALECELERMEGQMSTGQSVDIEVYGRLTGRLCRLLELIGVRRLSKPLDPLSELAKAVEGYAVAPVDDDDDGDDNEPLAIEAAVDHEPGEA
jgi:hypothetical protein